MIIDKYFSEFTATQHSQFEALFALYQDWNSKINVISRKDMDHFYERHVLHSLGIACVADFKPGTQILDVGTGGGFPGIPLAIFFPEVEFHLVDSIGKKIKVVSEVATALGLKNVKAEQARAEKLPGKYDFIVSRAVTDIREFYGWVKNLVKKEAFNELDNGLLCLKGGELKEEFRDFRHHHRFYELKEYFEEEFFETKKLVYVRM